MPAEPRVFPVGRLDWDTEGLLVLTNDGDLTQRLTHPSHGVEKEYLVEVDGVPSRGALRPLREGVELDDGRTAPAEVRLVQARGDHAAIELVIHEGRNRQVRRMCEAIGHPVRRLVRTRIGTAGRSRRSRRGSGGSCAGRGAGPLRRVAEPVAEGARARMASAGAGPQVACARWLT